MPRSRGWRNSGGRDWSVTDNVKRVGAQHLEKSSPRSRRCLQRQLAGGFLPYCVQWCEFLMTMALPAVNRVSHSSHLFLHVKRAAEEGQCVTEKGIYWHEILHPLVSTVAQNMDLKKDMRSGGAENREYHCLLYAFLPLDAPKSSTLDL